VLYFFHKGHSRLTCETRLNPAGAGYELAITTDGVTNVESFDDLTTLLSREHELLQEWRAMGWRDGAGSQANDDPEDSTEDPDWLSRR